MVVHSSLESKVCHSCLFKVVIGDALLQSCSYTTGLCDSGMNKPQGINSVADFKKDFYDVRRFVAITVTLESMASITITQASHLSLTVAIPGLSLKTHPPETPKISMCQYYGKASTW